MSAKRVILLRSNPVAPDPPVEKAADVLVSQGYNVTVVGWDRDGKQEQTGILTLQRGNAEVVRFGIPAVFDGGLKKNLLPLITFQKKMFSWLKLHRNEYDVIHAFDFDTGMIANMITSKYHKVLVYHILDFYVDSHHLPTGWLKETVKKAEYGIMNKAYCTILCTEKRKEQIAGSRPRKLEIIHNTPKQSNIVCDPVIRNSEEKRCRIVYVGILADSRFIRELIQFVKNEERFELHIGGFGILEEEIAQVSRACERIVFYGKLPYEKTISLEASCDVMTAIYDPAVPNHRYAAPNKFYEALMLGKPVIMAKNTGYDEIVTENEIGCLIDFTEEGLAQGLNKLYRQIDSWDAMGKRMQELYQSKYSWVEMEKRLIALYAGIDDEKDTDRKQ